MDFPVSGGFVPPDTDAAAGPTQIIEVVNSTITIYTKAGVQLSQQPLDTFFGGGATGLFDPVVSYDELSKRFIVAALQEDDATVTSFLWVAVSNNTTATGGFTEIQKIDVKETVPSNLWGDYPKLGWNADAVVVTLNMFTFPAASAGGAIHAQIVTLQKTTLLDANPATLTKFQVDRPEFTLAAATMHGAVAGGPMYFVSAVGGNNVEVLKMTNILNAAPTFAATTLAVNAYGATPLAVQLGAGGTIDAGDTRMLNAEWRGNKLVSSHTVGIGGVATARWYQFNTAPAVPTLTQQGNITPGAGIHTYYPAIAIAANGSLGMSYMQSSATQFVSMFVTGRLAGDALGTMEAAVLTKAGTKTYSDFSGPPHRAGDYSGIGIDPATGSFWAANEYATSAANNNWGTWITNFTINGVIIIGGGGGGTIIGIGSLKLFNPLRYTYNAATGIYSGNLTITNIGTRTVTGPFTVVFPPPSSGIIVVNPTGYTATGRPFITVSGALGRRSSLHIAILLRNPSKVPLGTFFLGFPITLQ